MTELILAFWAGGVVAVTVEIWLEWEGGSDYFEVARLMPWRFGAFLLAMVLLWPAGLALKRQLQLRQQRQEEEDEAEYERIEAMRKPLAVVGFCPHCGEQTELQPSEPDLTTFVMWVCGRCSNLCRVELRECQPVDHC